MSDYHPVPVVSVQVAQSVSHLLSGRVVDVKGYQTVANPTEHALVLKLEYREDGVSAADSQPLHMLLTPPAAYQLSQALMNALREYLGDQKAEI